MEVNTLCYLLKLYNLVQSKKGEPFFGAYEKLKKETGIDIVDSVPAEIKRALDSYTETKNEQDSLLLSELLAPYREQCLSLLPSLKEERKAFFVSISKLLEERGYSQSRGAFRKIKGNRLYIIEADLSADFAEKEYGLVSAIRVFPVIRIAEVKLKKQGLIGGVVPSSDATIADIRAHCPTAFNRRLLHLKETEIDVEATEVSLEEIEKLSKEVLIAAAVCENRKIPKEYKKLCRGDFPIGRSFFIAFTSALLALVVSLIVLSLVTSVVTYLALGFEVLFLFNGYVWGISIGIAVLYGLFSFISSRNGRY